MALDANAKMSNIKSSIDYYIYTNLKQTESIEVDFEGLKFLQDDALEWIQPRILDINSQYLRKSSTTKYGELTNILLQFNVFVKKSEQQSTVRHYQIRDIIADYFKIGETINIADYESGSTTTINNLRVRDIVTDRPIEETQALYQYAIAFEIDYTKQTTK